MSFVSLMLIEVRAGERTTALAAFKKRRVFEECAQAIPGFIESKLMVSKTEPNQIIVMAEWENNADYTDWTQHSVRSMQDLDLGHFLAAVPVTLLCDVEASWPQPTAVM